MAVNSNACFDLLNGEEQRISTKPIWTPFAGHNMAPWVKIWFIGNDFCVSVGNDSMPGGPDCCDIPGGSCEGGGDFGERGECMGQKMSELQYTKNHAVIKSFQYGLSGGKGGGSDGIKVEILDEQGSEFCNFMINIFPKNRDGEQPATNCKMAFQFGWIVTDCNNNPCKILSRQRVCYPLQVDVSFVGGVVKFAINACNPGEVLIEGVSNTRTEYTGQLKPAIVEMFKDHNIEPLFLTAVSRLDCGNDGGGCFSALADVCFANQDYNFDELSSYPEWKFFLNEGCDGTDPGAEQAWKTDNKDPITAASTWLQDKATKGDPTGKDGPPPRGFVVGGCNLIGTSNNTIFWESPLPDCKGNAPHMKNIGTFIVNGGECSNVLSFNPQINWQVANVTQGGNSSQTTARATEAKQTCDLSGKGTNEIVQIQGTTSEKYPGTDGEVTATAHAANARAQPPAAAVEAELLIQGNPYLDDPIALCAGVECSIVVINPFMLRPSTGGCPEWLADPPMNMFLSNKHWLICGVSHEIKEGSFTTTLKVWLATPGVDIDRFAQLGGDPGPYLEKV